MYRQQGTESETSGDRLEDEIGEITPIPLAQEGGTVYREALASQVADPESDLVRHLHKLSTWMAWQCDQDEDDLRQTYLLKMWASTCPIQHPIGWLNTAASNDRKNLFRHKKVETAYLEKSSSDAQESTRRNGKPLVQCASVPNPEQELLDKERQSLLKETVHRVLEEFPAEILDRWIMGKTPKAIARETGRPLSTVYRILKSMEKKIISAKEEIEMALDGKSGNS